MYWATVVVERTPEFLILPTLHNWCTPVWMAIMKSTSWNDTSKEPLKANLFLPPSLPTSNVTGPLWVIISMRSQVESSLSPWWSLTSQRKRTFRTPSQQSFERKKRKWLWSHTNLWLVCHPACPLLCIHESIHRRFIAPISTMTSPHLSIEAMMVCRSAAWIHCSVITETNDNNKHCCGN